MTPASLLSALEARGATVTLREGRPRCETAAGALNDELRSKSTKPHLAKRQPGCR